MTETKVGRYRVYFWSKLSLVGHDGWVVEQINPHGGLGEILSKHQTKKSALEQAKRYDSGDKRRGYGA